MNAPAGPGDPGLEMTDQPEAVRVLIVERGESIRRLLGDVDSDDWLVVASAHNARQAYRLLDGDLYPVVIVDLPVAGAAPEEFLRRIVELDPEQADHLIFVTADLSESEIRRFLTDVDRPFLTKPLDGKELLDLAFRTAAGESDSD